MTKKTPIKVIFDDWEEEADFMARQIVDDLTRAGLTALYYQHIVEQTLLRWAKDRGALDESA